MRQSDLWRRIAKVLLESADEHDRDASDGTTAPGDDVLTLAQAARPGPSGVSERTLRKAIKAGDLAATKPGKCILLRRGDVIAWRDARTWRPGKGSGGDAVDAFLRRSKPRARKTKREAAQ